MAIPKTSLSRLIKISTPELIELLTAVPRWKVEKARMQRRELMLLAWCQEAKIKLSTAQLKGGLKGRSQFLYFNQVRKLIEYLSRNPRVPNTNRLALLGWITGLDRESEIFMRSGYTKAGGYLRFVEAEIEHIAHLAEPWRTVQATGMLNRIRDAKTLAELGKKQVESHVEELDSSISRLEEMSTGGYRNQSFQTRSSKKTGRRSGSGAGSGSSGSGS